MKHDRKNLINTYIQNCWVIKLRLMSSRRQLWCNDTSLIHLENACLQMRKICEGVAKLCLVAGHVEYDDIPKSAEKHDVVGKTFRHLKKIDRLKFIGRARSALINKNNGKKSWHITKEKWNNDDVEKVKKIYDKCGNALHEVSLFHNFPSNGNEAAIILFNERNALRCDHKWLWNFLWQHALELSDSPIFFVNFNSNKEMDNPTIAFQDGFLDETIEAGFVPDFVADFHCPIKWDDFDEPQSGTYTDKQIDV